MNRSPLVDRFGLRSKASSKVHVLDTHLGIEPLEERRLLSGNDLLITTVDGYVNGDSVLRYNEATRSPVPGSVATGVGGMYYATGLAVAPDGSYYVSSFGAGVLHFANSGIYLGVLGADLLQGPGTLEFGPNGNLYVADLSAGDIYQFDTASQQLVDTLSTGPGSEPGGFTFAKDGTNDLIVGSMGYESVVRYHANGDPATTLIQSGSGNIFPSALLALSNGSLLIADFDFTGQEPYGHHQILECDAASGANLTQFASFSTPLGTGTALNHPAQPEALMLDADGNLLVGLSPDHNGNGAVEELDQNGNYVATIASGIGTPSGLGYVPQLSVMSVAPADWPTTGPAGLTLKRDGNGLLHIYDSTGDVVPAQSLDNVGEIQVNGPDNTASTLTIDFGPGSPIPLDGVSFAGGANSGTNTIIISGSSDLSGTIQTTGTGSVILGQGSSTTGKPSSSPFSIESGTITTSLTGTGGLIVAGPGTVTLSGSNSYQGFMTATGSTLDVTSSAALPDGTGLLVGAKAAAMSGAQGAARAPLALSSPGAVVDVLPAATVGAFASAPTANVAVAVAAPEPRPALVADSKSASASRSALSLTPTAIQPADSPSNVASDSLWRVYPRSKVLAAVRASGAAGYLAWWNSAARSSNTDDFSTETDRRVAAVDAVLAQYGNS